MPCLLLHTSPLCGPGSGQPATLTFPDYLRVLGDEAVQALLPGYVLLLQRSRRGRSGALVRLLTLPLKALE